MNNYLIKIKIFRTYTKKKFVLCGAHLTGCPVVYLLNLVASVVCGRHPD